MLLPSKAYVHRAYPMLCLHCWCVALMLMFRMRLLTTVCRCLAMKSHLVPLWVIVISYLHTLYHTCCTTPVPYLSNVAYCWVTHSKWTLDPFAGSVCSLMYMPLKVNKYCWRHLIVTSLCCQVMLSALPVHHVAEYITVWSVCRVAVIQSKDRSLWLSAVLQTSHQC